MLFRTLPRASLPSLVQNIQQVYEVVGPKQVATTAAGKPVHQYLPVESFDELCLDYETTEHSAKTYFLPYKEALSTYRFEGEGWEQQIAYRLQPRAIIGLHACDINALLRLDKVFIRDIFPSPYYISRRRNTFIVGLDHPPCDHGFCRSLGTDTVTHGFDLFLTDLGDRYFVAVGSDRGFVALQGVQGVGEICEQDRQDYQEARRRVAAGFTEQVDVRNLANLLDIEFESPVWQRWGERCLSCGSCAMACPTCYCYGVAERVSMDGSRATKFKQLYSCNLKDFAEVAGGHNFRPDRQTRLKYRYYHQHRGFAEAHEEPMCVGCNRCGRACLAGINPPEIIRDLTEEGHP